MFLPKLPYGGLSHIAMRLGLCYSTVYGWRRHGVPVKYQAKLKVILSNMDLEPRKLNNLPYGGVAQIARLLSRPYTTVHNWARYGIPIEHRKEVDRVMGEIGIDK